jgi:hypothetical protein
VLKQFHVENAYPAKAPLDFSLPLLAKPEDQRGDVTLYQELIGSLNGLAVFSQPDIIANSVSELSAFMQDSTETHMKAACRVLRHLTQTRNLSLTYGGLESLNLFGFSDSNGGVDRNDRKSL